MKPEQVFCESCGKERLLVPVFEPEIEMTVEQSMSDIVKEIEPELSGDDSAVKSDLNNDKETSSEAPVSLDTKERSSQKTVSGGFWLGVLVLVLIAICAFSLLFFVVYRNSYDYNMERAKDAYKRGDYDLCIEFADAALAVDEEALDPRLLKISVYEERGDTDTVLDRCLAFIKRDPENETIYRKIISIYIEREQFVALNTLLMDCPISPLVEEYRDYTSFPPEFDMEEGEYDESISVKLLEIGNGSIFYTLDGSDVDEYSTRYEGPIKLDAGEYTINAIYINTFGLVSKTVTRTYIINNKLNLEVEVEPESGEYAIPKLIKVNIPEEDSENCTVYYTTDKKDPTTSSNEYSGPIYMPLGESTFKFLMIDGEGNESEIVEREFELNVDTDKTIEDAVQIVTYSMVVRGDILDGNGAIPGSEDFKEYRFEGAHADEDDNVYYLVSEYLRSSDQKPVRTGNIYAFSVKDGLVYKAVLDDDMTLKVENF